MARTNWSQTWATTRRTTTTSRRLLKRRRKYLRLQADQRLKQNREDIQLLAHLRELYPFVKEYGLILIQELNSIKLTQWQKDWTLFLGMDNYLEKWDDRSLETERWSSERFCALLTLVWGYVEEQDGRRWRQSNISTLCWSVRTRNSSPPSSSRSFRTQSRWSYTAGQCVDSEQFLRVHLSYWMCSLCTLHHKLRISSGRTKFKQGKTDGILYSRESHE